MADAINGTYELLGGYFIFLHIRALCRDKDVKGVSWSAVCFFTTWGYWNLFYYPYLNQYLSFVGGVAIAITNTTWLALIIYYKRHPKTNLTP